jgi:hypothetical protein
MIRAQRGLLERQSLEDSLLIADGEDLSGSCKFAFLFVHPMEPDLIFLLVRFMPVFSRPGPAAGSFTVKHNHHFKFRWRHTSLVVV